LSSGATIARALILWAAGFVIGGVVFSVPALRGAPAIPFVSSNPYITAPILIVWTMLSCILARPLLTRTADPVSQGLRIGLLFAAVNAMLDLVVVVGLMGNGPGFYAYAGPWVAYATLVAVPWLTGRALSAK
jgi:hypothetical protein